MVWPIIEKSLFTSQALPTIFSRALYFPFILLCSSITLNNKPLLIDKKNLGNMIEIVLRKTTYKYDIRKVSNYILCVYKFRL